MKLKSTIWVRSAPGAIALGAVISLVITLLGTALVASLVNGEMISENSVRYGVILTLLAASFLSATVASKLAQNKKMLIALAVGGIMFILLLAMNALFYSGQYRGVGYTLLMIIAGSVSGVLLETRGNNMSKKYKRKKPNR